MIRFLLGNPFTPLRALCGIAFMNAIIYAYGGSIWWPVCFDLAIPSGMLAALLLVRSLP